MTERPFPLDRFQAEAIEAVDAGRSVLVAAPTGAGKTVVAEHAAALALAGGGRVFYTTPIKALSNQKFRDLAARHGAGAVGLLTGDNTVNAGAPVVVMTTEVLRNMIYAQSAALEELRWVVLDEVHYLRDPYRGPVWEEVIIQLPAAVRLVCLSATVSNVEDLGAWISDVRGPVEVVVEHRRPVPLENLYAVADRERHELVVVPVLVKGRPNPRGARFDWVDAGGGRGRRRRHAPPRRLEILDWLAARDLLPAIHFVFSRAGCDDAARDAWRSGMAFTDEGERAAIGAIVDRHAARLSDDEASALGLEDFRSMLQQGVAAHHAGMVPPFKEAVEEAFAAGLVRLVYATETLALGVNMPARTVVLEKLTKYSGAGHVPLDAGEYTQLTGRAGRRGIDTEGRALVCWSPFVPFAEVAQLAASREYPLRSAFRPTYNMAANLLRRHDPAEARSLLERSFAQYQADRRVVRAARRVARLDERAADAREAAHCELGDVAEYRELRLAAGRRDAAARRRANAARRAALGDLRPGDVIGDPADAPDRRAGPLAVLAVSHRSGGAVRVRTVDARGRVRNLGEDAFAAAPRVGDRLPLPDPYTPGDRGFQRRVAAMLRDVAPVPAPVAAAAGREASHPVAACPDAAAHLEALDRAERLTRDADRLRRELARATGTIAAQFDAVVDLLTDWGHLEDHRPTPDRGARLAGLFHECDLLVAEAVARGLLDDLDAPSLAGVVSCFCYEHRSPEPAPTPWFPTDRVQVAVDRIEDLAARLNAAEERRRLPLTRRPDPTFLAIAHAWAAGAPLGTVLDEDLVSAGDFVRTVRVVVDLLRQIAQVAGPGALRRTAEDAAGRLQRGVVSLTTSLLDASAGGEPAPEAEPAPDVGPAADAAVRSYRRGDGGREAP